MTVTFASLSGAVLILLIIFLIKKYTYWKRRGIPTAKGIFPFIGHMLPVLSTRLNYSELNRKLYDENKNHSMVGYYKMTSPALLIREPYLAQIVLSSKFSNFQATGTKLHPDMDPLLSRNVFFNIGEEWASLRKRLMSTFSNVKLKSLFEAVNGVCKKIEDYVDRRLGTDDKYEVELKELCARFTGEVMANAGLSVEGYCFDEKPHPAAFDRIGTSLFRTGLKEVLEMTVVFTPGLSKLWKVKLVPEKIERFFKEMVTQNLMIRRKDPRPRFDFLQLVLDYDATRNAIIDEELLAADIFTFYVNGFETSSIVLSFSLYLMSKHPDVQEKLRQEVMCKINKHNGVLTFEGLREMTYMDQVIDETQRCFPAIGFITRICTEPIELRGSDGLVCHVEPGTEVVVSNHGFQLDPQYWPDPEVFDPERFNDERKQTIDKMTHLPFGQGPRICPGIKMAQLQMKACLATLVSKYKFELSEKTRHPIEFTGLNFLTSPIGGLWVRITKI